ncbi:MAG: SRPBCC family protein [Acidimicrobiales bacterium]
MLRECEASVEISASPEAVWSFVSDVTRVGEWSGECRACIWMGEPASAQPGARFKGRNRRGVIRWTRLNEVVRADAPNELVWRTVPGGPYLDSVEWRLSIGGNATCSKVSESFRIVKMPDLMRWLIPLALPAHRDRSDDLAADLGRLKLLVETGSAG